MFRRRTNRRRVKTAKKIVKIAKYKAPSQVHWFRRLVVQDGVLSTTVPNNYLNMSFTLADVPDVSDFTALYDEYRLVAVKVRIEPVFSNNINWSNQAGTTLYTAGRIYGVVDKDGYGGIMTLTQMLQHGNCKYSRAGGGITFNLKPHILSNVDGGTSQKSTTGWIDMSSTGIKHYGLNLLVDGYNAEGMNFRIIKEYVFGCKGTR